MTQARQRMIETLADTLGELVLIRKLLEVLLLWLDAVLRLWPHRERMLTDFTEGGHEPTFDNKVEHWRDFCLETRWRKLHDSFVEVPVV